MQSTFKRESSPSREVVHASRAEITRQVRQDSCADHRLATPAPPSNSLLQIKEPQVVQPAVHGICPAVQQQSAGPQGHHGRPVTGAGLWGIWGALHAAPFPRVLQQQQQGGRWVARLWLCSAAARRLSRYKCPVAFGGPGLELTSQTGRPGSCFRKVAARAAVQAARAQRPNGGIGA